MGVADAEMATDFRLVGTRVLRCVLRAVRKLASVVLGMARLYAVEAGVFAEEPAGGLVVQAGEVLFGILA